VRVRLIVEVEKLDDYRYTVSASCEGDRDVCALIQRLKSRIAEMIAEEMRFAEKLKNSNPYISAKRRSGAVSECPRIWTQCLLE